MENLSKSIILSGAAIASSGLSIGLGVLSWGAPSVLMASIVTGLAAAAGALCVASLVYLKRS